MGLPLLLGSVTTIALLVHFAILTHTTWFGGYWQGKGRPVAMAPAAPAATTMAVAPTAAPPAAQ